ncbi:basic proline-rich protein-like [Melospiza melodia melodia]|uniref:basic proline-rich protein-like n=1 Tax=Melospiza melodia melodia TaxID=1914991 RepID=UPI002FD1317D
MSQRPQHREVPPRAQRPLPSPGTKPRAAKPPRPKRLRTKRERDAAKFGPKPPPLGGCRPPWAPRRRPQPPQRGGLALGSPLGPPKPVVITQHRLCHRGLFNHEVKSLDVRRLLTPGPAGDGPPAPGPPNWEGAQRGGLPGEALGELVAGLASLLGGLGLFVGRDLVSERRRSLVAALRKHHRRGPPDLGVFLAHRTPAQPAGTAPDPRGGSFSPQNIVPFVITPKYCHLCFHPKSSAVSSRDPREEARPGPPGQVVSLGGWEVGVHPAGTPSPLHVGHTVSAPKCPKSVRNAPKNLRNCPKRASKVSQKISKSAPKILQLPPRTPSPIFGALRERENPFSWSSAEDEEDETPGGLPQTWAGRGGLLPPPPPFWRSPQPPPQPPWGSPEPPRTPSRLLWDLARAPPTPPRPCRAPQIWSPDPPRPPWDPRPWSPEPPRAPLDAPRPPWDPPDAPRPLWDSPDPRQSPQLWSAAPAWDPPAAPRPSRDPRPWSPEPPGAPQDTTEPSRCCCRRRLCRDMAQRRNPLCHQRAARPCRDPFHRAPPPLCRDVPCRDPPRCCHQPPKRRRPDWGGVGGRPWGGGSSPSPPVPGGCGCPCRGGCWAGAAR